MQKLEWSQESKMPGISAASLDALGLVSLWRARDLTHKAARTSKLPVRSAHGMLSKPSVTSIPEQWVPVVNISDRSEAYRAIGAVFLWNARRETGLSDSGKPQGVGIMQLKTCYRQSSATKRTNLSGG